MVRDIYGCGKFFDENSSGQLLAHDPIMQETKGVIVQCTPSNSGANLNLIFCGCNGLFMFTGDDFDDDDLSLLPSDISIFFLDSTCGWVSPSLEALNESLSFCPNDSAIRASNELNKDIIVIETWIKEVGCVYFESN
ncbi:hypothetical protein DKX38_018253 [Salix brachista]|uniref:Uncharacterized protein n=1 Tax=Salix brachista TaxID=2182728 RepID=A0A5N5KMI7_9ROSI|nr:hypothetical protein DKX38_018253 [Salix brachista]